VALELGVDVALCEAVRADDDASPSASPSAAINGRSETRLHTVQQIAVI